MLKVVDDCFREAITCLPSESDESNIDTDDTPAKIEYKVCTFFELVLMNLLYTGWVHRSYEVWLARVCQDLKNGPW